MALTNYILLAALVTNLPFIENAPSSNIKARGDRVDMRLVFIDNRDGNEVSSKSGFVAESNRTPVQKNTLTKTTQRLRPVFAPNNPPLENNVPLKHVGLPRMDDDNQNWGLIADDKDLTEEDSYYNRPLNIPKTINMKAIRNEKTAKVHLKIPHKSSETIVTKPSVCDTAIITCCTNLEVRQQSNCFKLKGCVSVTDDMFSSVCSRDSIYKAISNMADYYTAS